LLYKYFGNNMRRNCTDYDGMGNQGRFPMTKKSINVENKTSRTFIITIVCILISLLMLTSCEKELLLEQVCCDWDATNFDPEYNGHNVNQLYFTGSSLCNNELCIYP
tara:strand:+ start:541 stop:861 length:321 start_codon:yes stop_codon:yes gene_type:complete